MYIPGASSVSQLTFRGNYKLCFSVISAEFGLTSEKSMGISALCMILLMHKEFESDDGSNLILLRLILSVLLPKASYRIHTITFLLLGIHQSSIISKNILR